MTWWVAPFLSLFQFVTSEPTGGGSYDLIAHAFPLLLRAQTAHSMTIEQAAHSQRSMAWWDVLLSQRHEQGLGLRFFPFRIARQFVPWTNRQTVTTSCHFWQHVQHLITSDGTTTNVEP